MLLATRTLLSFRSVISGAFAVSSALLSISSVQAAAPAPPAASRASASSASSPAPQVGGIGTGLGTIGDNLREGLETVRNNLRDGFGNLGDGLGRLGNTVGIILSSAGGNYVDPTPGATSEEGFIQYQGLARRFVLVRPVTAVAGAPVLILLHPNGLSPERMVNLTTAGRLAAEYGAWIYLPEAQGGDWNDDPGNIFGADDVGFIGRLIDSAVATHGLDANRVYAAGYSNGGFMAERLGCELSAKLAGFATAAATLRDSVGANCHPTHNLPAAFFNGTGDLIVPYSGIPTLASAANTAAFWARQANCTAGQTTSTSLPDLDPRDGTRVTLLRYSACPAGAGVRLYTVTGGGHTWPGSVYAGYTFALGRTTFDVDATIEAWNFLSQYQRPAAAAR